MSKSQGSFLVGDRRRRLLAFVESETPATDSPYSRIGLVLDCIDGEAFTSEPGRAQDDDNDLALVRILSTPQRLKKLFDLHRTPKEGDWLAIEVGYSPGEPPAWILPATRDYSGPHQRSNLVGMKIVPTESEASGRRERCVADDHLDVLACFMTAETLAAQHNPDPPRSSESGDGQLTMLLSMMISQSAPFLHPRVLDVGQASCAILHTSTSPHADIACYFDVGAPLWFHNGSMPKHSDFRLPTGEAPVILSHWDFDHYALALWREPRLREFTWFAPKQDVGRNGMRFREKLRSLRYIEDDQVGVGDLRLYRGEGPHSDRNASGYVFWVDGPYGPRLLTGDVGYEYIVAPAKQGLRGVSIPHHGAAGGSPPAPGKGGVAVASYGLHNRYKHPNSAALDAHSDLLWQIKHTAKTEEEPRGSRWL